MDPMDFTMDDASNVLGGSAHRYQCQQPQTQSHSHSHSQTNGPSFGSQGPSHSRENQHYDPVHESSAWYQQHNANTASRAPYAPPPSISQWSSNPHTDPTQNWSQFADMERLARNQDYQPPDYRQAFMPWSGEPRAFDSFNHPAYMPAPSNGGSNMSTDAAPHSRVSGSLRGYGMDQQQQQQQYPFSRGMPRPQFSTMPSNTAPPEPRPSQVDSAAPSSVGSSITPQPPSFTALRSGFSRSTRPNIPRHEDMLDGSRRRRLAAAWDSDDDEESLVEIERMEVARRHAAEALFGGDFDDERSIAALRGAVAANGKRVPSKEALDSLVSLKVADLKDADRTCIICYNEFGVSNPEGETENPIRLPKCKHIFGDKCIKKWFEDSDSCPYCRDKLPSELAVRKSLGAYQSYRLAHREQMRLASLTQRSRYSSYTPAGGLAVPAELDNTRNSAAAQRAHEEYEFIMARQADAWSYSPAGRSATGDSPERRRQARGRHSAMRGPHFLGRPTSVGSARPSNPAFTHQSARNFTDFYGLTPQRRNAASEAPGREAREIRDRDARTAALASTASPYRASWGHSSPDSSVSAGRTPPERPPPGSSMPAEEASPPVAVGSGVSTRRQVDQQGLATSRLSLDSDNSDFMFDPSGPEPGSAEGRGSRQNEPSRGIPSFGTLLEVSNSSSTRFGADSSNDAEDLAHIGRMDVGIPPGWGSIN